MPVFGVRQTLCPGLSFSETVKMSFKIAFAIQGQSILLKKKIFHKVLLFGIF